MPKKPTAADAELILKLYDLRREAEMRKARAWWVQNFWPENADDFIKLAMSPGTQENNWLRQVIGYWEMAASFVLNGVLSETLFLQTSVSGEMFIILAKLHPHLKEIRAKMQSPEFFGNVEKVVKASKVGRERLQQFEGRVSNWRNMMKEKMAKAS